MLDSGEDVNTSPGYFGQWTALTTVEDQEEELSLESISEELEQIDDKIEGICKDAQGMKAGLERDIEVLLTAESTCVDFCQKLNKKNKSYRKKQNRVAEVIEEVYHDCLEFLEVEVQPGSESEYQRPWGSPDRQWEILKKIAAEARLKDKEDDEGDDEPNQVTPNLVESDDEEEGEPEPVYNLVNDRDDRVLRGGEDDDKRPQHGAGRADGRTDGRTDNGDGRTGSEHSATACCGAVRSLQP